MKLPYQLTCIDIETTSLDPVLGSIIQLSAITVDTKFETIKADDFDIYVEPLNSYRDKKAMDINKIVEDTLCDAPTLNEALELFENYCGKNTILASWGSYFDIPFLKKQYEKINREYPFSYKTIDLKSIAIWEMSKRDAKATGGVSDFLKTLEMEFVGIEHNSLDDIKNAVEVLRFFNKI
jgi:DNA polymerase III alpha subunit (gram-positive type)